jgi:hypothetical protein
MMAKRSVTIAVVGSVLSAACIDVEIQLKNRPGSSGPPAVIEIVSGNEQVGIAGTTLSAALVVRLIDADGRPVNGRPVSFRVVGGDGTLATESAVTDDSGLAATRWTLGPVASEVQRVRAILVVPETGTGLAALFGADAVPGEPFVTVVRRGNGQTGRTDASLADMLELEVRDRFGNPVPGVAVGWRVASGGGAIEPDGAYTDAEGVARARWTMGPNALPDQQVVARATGTEPVAFAAQVLSVRTTFREDFELGLEGWTGRGDGRHFGLIVSDPLNPSNRVLTFSRGGTAGDIFSDEIFVDQDAEYELSFDYLGIVVPGSAASNHGGFIGISEALPGRHVWIAGTDPLHARNDLVDDGTWHTYTFRFRPSSHLTAPLGRLRLMLEDAQSPGGLPGAVGDAFFDNVHLRGVSP